MTLDVLEPHHIGVPEPRRAPAARRWRMLGESLSDRDVASLVARVRFKIEQDAHMIGVDLRCVETQFRLHLPSLSRAELMRRPSTEIYERLRPITLIIAASIREACEEVQYRARASSLLLGGEKVRREPSVTRTDGLRIPLRFGVVPATVGYAYQARLHYMRSPRPDTDLELGYYLVDSTHPLTYVAFSPCDRSYLVAALNRCGLPVKQDEVLVLSRVYGLPGLPRNLLSLTIASAVRELRARSGFKVLVTAYNPTLGFGGTSFQASGFVPFATCPVSYSYDSHGRFTTRRASGVALGQALDTPNNVLVALGVEKQVRRRLARLDTITEVDVAEYADVKPMIEPLPALHSGTWIQRLFEYRKLLESAWSERTIHPSYLCSPQLLPSRGQCGVSSVWLARELHSLFAIDATYCYGRLSFDDNSIAEVDHHCWLEVGAPHDPSRVVIDLTCDQAEGLGEQVLSGTFHDLRLRGIHYEPRARLSFHQLQEDRVWRRFQALREALQGATSDLANGS